MADESIWKKEITLGRKKKAKAEQQPAPEAGAAAAPAPAAATPFWKKEISLGKKKDAAAPVAPAAPAAEAAAQPAKPEPVPFWKKEISLGKKSHAPAETPAEQPAAAKGDDDEVPFWKRDLFAPKVERLNDADGTAFLKKEIPLSRKQQQEVDRLAGEAARAVAPEPQPLAHEPIKAAEAAARALIADPNAEIEIFFQAPATQSPAAAATPAAPDTLAEPQPTHAPQPALPEPAAEVAPPGLEPLPEPPALDLPAAPQPSGPAPAPAAQAPPREPAPPVPAAPQRAAQEVHPPVPAAQLPPLPEEPKVPFWKKEISFSSKPKPQTIPAIPGASTAKPSGPTPWYRQKVEIGRRPAAGSKKSGDEVSIWKKEISFGGGKKKAAATAASATAEPAVQAPAAAEPKVPFWKKEIGGKKKTAAAAPAVAAAKPAKSDVPFWKRELSVKSLKNAQVSKPKVKAGGGPRARSAGKKQTGKTKRLVGLKVGASQLAAARVSNNGVAELLQVARQPLEQGIVVSGELRDPDALAAQLKAFFARNKLPRKNVRLGIASNRIGVRIFDVVGIHDENQLANAIQFRAQEALPIPLDEAVLDYHVLSEGVDAEGQPMRRILLVVAYRELVDRYVTACKKAGIQLLGVDLEAFALLRALAAPRAEAEPAKAALVGVAIGHDRSTFAVSDGRVCEFTRVLEWGGAALNVAMARALDLAPSEVEGYKRALMLDGPAPVPEGLTQEQWAAALDAVRRQLQSFARELVSSLQFYQNQPGSLGIGEIVLAGGTAHMPGLAEELQRLIGVNVRIGDPLARVKVAKGVGQNEPMGSLAVAIGLGIED